MNYDDLYGDFPELLAPGVVLEREILAHFGLTFSGFALLEAALQNLYIYWKLDEGLRDRSIADAAQWSKKGEYYQQESFDATFGSLLKMNAHVDHLDEVRPELERLKRCRDYLAHHFFREENGNMLTDERRRFLLLSMAILRREIEAAEIYVDRACHTLLQGMFPKADLDLQLAALSDQLRAEILGNSRLAVGWDTSPENDG